MIRNDFVSNSSSCSFIVNIPNEVDCISFKNTLPEILKRNVDVRVFEDLDDVYNSDGGRCVKVTEESDKDLIQRGNAVELYFGEDNCYPEANEVFKKYDDFMKSMSQRYDIYKHPWASTTSGKDYPYPEKAKIE